MSGGPIEVISESVVSESVVAGKSSSSMAAERDEKSQRLCDHN